MSDATASQQNGRLQIRDNTDVYLSGGSFGVDRMLSAFEEMAASARRAGGIPLSRVACRMECASEDQSRIQDVTDFKSRVNNVWRRYDDAAICTCHLAQLGRDAVIDIMRTRRMVTIGGHLQQNPFFTRPEEFLSESHGRRSARTNPQ